MFELEKLTDKKNNGGKLNKIELQNFVDYIMSKHYDEKNVIDFIWSIYNNKMTFNETYNLTISMAKSGKIINLTSIGDCVDKHSTGGVSDSTTLIIVPVLASLGIKVAKMSGKSLGFTGGTADKLEVFCGYQNKISMEKFEEIIKQCNASIITQTDNLSPADKIIYSLRDKIGAVDNISLIASSIMSKKIACGCKFLILDVKFGQGALMEDYSKAKKLAKVMVKIGNKYGIKTIALLTSMDEPLTKYIGNNVEVYSILKVLNGEKNRLYCLSKELVISTLLLCSKCSDILEVEKLFEKQIKSKMALKKLKQIVTLHSGNTDCFKNADILLPKLNKIYILCGNSGYITKINSSNLGNALHLLMQTENDKKIKFQISIILAKQINDKVNNGDIFASIYYHNKTNLENAIHLVQNCFEIKKSKTTLRPLVKEIIK